MIPEITAEAFSKLDGQRNVLLDVKSHSLTYTFTYFAGQTKRTVNVPLTVFALQPKKVDLGKTQCKLWRPPFDALVKSKVPRPKGKGRAKRGDRRAATGGGGEGWEHARHLFR
eukprot:9530555-Alexandrium_andersonii.AAC.1